MPHPRSIRHLAAAGSMRSLLGTLIAFGSLRASGAGDPLFEAFATPPTAHRPFVRWWWNGGRLDAGELVRELDVMAAAGIGGIEINPIAQPEGASETSLVAHPVVPWLSPAWLELVRLSAAAARERGLETDLILGSGWPIGGRFVPPEAQTQRVRLVRRTLVGPTTLSMDAVELLDPREIPAAVSDPVPSSRDIVFLRLVRSDQSDAFEPGRELLASLGPDGKFSLDVPPGPHALLVGLREVGFTHVKLGAPGADGPVLDHFNARAVRGYLDHAAAALAPVLGGRLGPAIRAVFIDSLELDHANWTGDLPHEFAARRGYELTPYLPFVLGPPPAPTSAHAEAVLRARHDFHRTLVELFEERFLGTFATWAREQHVQSRMQAYGREAHPLHGSMAVDLPEGETWLWLDKADDRRLRIESTVVNRYVASAANLSGRRVRSFEAMTNAVPVFRETLRDFKRALDETLVAGLNHPIIHGFNYTPPDAGFPGWVRFGSYLNERSPWWRYFPEFSTYAARLGGVLRATEKRARIGILAPRADEWARHGLLYQPFPEVADPWYQFQLIEAVHEAGYGADYISERILAEGVLAEGKLRFGAVAAYEMILVAAARSLDPATFRRLEAFAAGGGQVIFLDGLPQRAPGLADATTADARVGDIARRLAAMPPGKVRVATAPKSPDNRALLDLVHSLLRESAVSPDVAWRMPCPTVTQLTQWEGDRAVHLLVNRDLRVGAAVHARFPRSRGQPYVWDPFSGTRHPLPLVEGAVELELEPGGSALVVFEPGESTIVARAQPIAASASPAQVLAGPWRLELHRPDGGEVTRHSLTELVDLSLSAESALRDFSGRAVYESEFAIEPSAGLVLDLGEVNDTSAVTLNGQSLGARWWGWHRYDLSGHLRPGRNHLRVEVTTSLGNLMRARRDDPAAQRWASWFPPIPSGLLGPVRILDRGASRAPTGPVSKRVY